MLLSDFCNECASVYEESGYPHGPFLPHTMPEYENANLKVFYIGQDTYGWKDKSHLLDSYRNNKLEDYIALNNSVISPELMLESGNNGGSFWGFVTKLHIELITGEYLADINNISDSQKRLINQLGYSNLYSIELQTTLQKEGVWDGINSSLYHKICEAGKKLNKLKDILDMYHPDIIFILTWQDNDDVFDGLETDCIQEMYEDKFRSIYTIKGYDTKIVWTCHPTSFKFKSTNAKEMSNYLCESVKMIK